MPRHTVTEVLPPESPLEAAKSTLLKHRDQIVRQEEEFQSATLLPRLCMGLAAMKAYMVFVHNPGRGGRPKKTVTRDGFSFEGWMEKEVPWFKKPTAYKYMQAVRGLGADQDSTEKEVAALLAKWEKPTLKALCDACADPVGKNLPAPPPRQTEFDFAKQVLCEYRVQSEHILAIKDTLNSDMLEVAQARAYQTLRDLTGKDWAPSDIPDHLAEIDPDSISLQ